MPFTKKNKQIMKKLYIRAGDLREGILKIDHWGKPSRERMGTLGSIRVKFLGDEEKMKGTYDVSSLSTCFEVQNST